MSKFQKILFAGLFIAIALLVYNEATKPIPINWFPSYHTQDKIPFGTFVFEKITKKILNNNLILVNQPPYTFLEKNDIKGTYIFVNNDFNIDKKEFESLLKWTQKGNTLFIAANYFDNETLDTLKVNTAAAFLYNKVETQPLLQLYPDYLAKKTPYHVKKNLPIEYFNRIDTLSHTGLGYVSPYNDTLKISTPKLNFIKIPHGEGTILLHTQPQIFTNYFLINKNHIKYTSQVLSYINIEQPVYYDQYHVTGKPIETSPLYLLLKNKYLKWAYYFCCIGVLFFILFQSKRTQRIIPVIPPLTNKSLAYTQTISGMYLDKKDYRGIALKQISFFLETIRSQYNLNTQTLNETFYKQLASKTNNTVEESKKLFKLINIIQQNPKIEKETLLKLYKEITLFKSKNYGGN